MKIDNLLVVFFLKYIKSYLYISYQYMHNNKEIWSSLSDTIVIVDLFNNIIFATKELEQYIRFPLSCIMIEINNKIQIKPGIISNFTKIIKNKKHPFYDIYIIKGITQKYLNHDLKNLLNHVVYQQTIPHSTLRSLTIKTLQMCQNYHKEQILSINRYIKNIGNYLSSLLPIDLIFSSHLEYQYFIKINEIDLDRILLNLLFNAYDAKAKRVLIRLETSKDLDNTQIVIKVKDYGKGIPDQFKDKVFNSFFSTKKNHDGLGLNFINNTVLYYQGSLKIFSCHHKYTEIILKFPIQKIEILENNYDDINILFIDDNNKLVDIMKQYFQREKNISLYMGVDIEYINHILTTINIHVIILDENLCRNYDGWSVYQNLLQTYHSKCKIIVTSLNLYQKIRTYYSENKKNTRMLLKPFTFEQLKSEILQNANHGI